MRIPFATQSYKSDSLPLSAQRCVNLFAEVAPPNAKTPVAVFGTPGLTTFANCGIGPMRALVESGGKVFAVADTVVCEVSASGAVKQIGAISSGGSVTAADGGEQVVLVADGKGYVIENGAVSAITDPDFEGAGSVAYLDGYFIFNRPGTGEWFISDLKNAKSYDALEFATAESNPDPLVRVFVDHREIWLFGTRTTEIWVNTGNAEFPFERQGGTSMEIGCASAGSVASLDNTVFWIADDRTVRRAQGYTPVRISTHAIEKELRKVDIASAIGFAYSQDGHAFYVLRLPTTTFVYDVATQLWHERQSGISPGPWRATCHADLDGKQLVGDDRSGRIFLIDPDATTEDGEIIPRIGTLPAIASENKRIFISRFEVEMETGVGLDGDGLMGIDPEIILDWSDDGGRTWRGGLPAPLGKIGAFRTNVDWRRLGQARDRVFRVTVTEPVKVVFFAANADLTRGG